MTKTHKWNQTTWPVIVMACLLLPATILSAETGVSGEASRDAGTLDAISIEGEIPLPQVLFISSREQPRYPDMIHRLYLDEYTAIGSAALPVRLLTLPAGLSQMEVW